MANALSKTTIKSLQAIVGVANVSVTPEELLCYAYDGTALEYPPAAVVFPGSSAEISRIMKLANQVPFVVVPRGAGTGMTGGALAVQGGVVLAMNRLNRILEIDIANQIAVVEPGVITGQFQAEVQRLGLFYPPDPASAAFCTMGGNVAECAGGPSAVKYGVTRDYVRGLELVLPDGRLLATGVRTAKGVAGYDLTRLFVGSEGTLGIITRITVSLLAAPAARQTFLVLCASMAQATTLVAKILAHHQPCTLEYMDTTALRIVAHTLPEQLPAATKALLLLELDGEMASLATQSQALMTFLATCPDLVAVRQAADPAEVAALWAARRAISPAAFSLRPHKLSEDVVVPRTRIPELVAFTEELGERLGLTIFTFGHAGDGNIHVNIMLDRAKADEVTKATLAKEQLFAKVLALGGTLSGEHGIGITKAAYLPMELGPVAMAVTRAIKDLFDPNGVLNPGKIIPADPAG
jgi:glycolate oxidase